MTTINNDNKELIKKVLVEAAADIPVEQICEQNGISKATYYAWYSGYICENGELVSSAEHQQNAREQVKNNLVKQVVFFK